MTRTTNARLAGSMFLLYIATAFPLTVMSSRASAGDGVAERLANIAQHAPFMRLSIALSFLIAIEALLLAVALYGLTRDEDHELAVLALSCRVGEGILIAIPFTSLALLWLATGGAGPVAPDATTVNTLGALILKVESWQVLITATLFAIGSTVFSWLFLRARSIPVWLAWLGVLASLLLVVLLPARLVDAVASPVTELMWLPMLVFEVVLGFWLLIKGVATPASART